MRGCLFKPIRNQSVLYFLPVLTLVIVISMLKYSSSRQIQELQPKSIKAENNIIYEFPGFAYQGDFSPDGRYLVFGGDTQISLLDLETQQVVREWQKTGISVKYLDFSGDSKQILCVEMGQPPRLWDIQTSQTVQTFPDTPPQILANTKPKITFWDKAHLSYDGSHVIARENTGLVKLWNTQDRQVVRVIDQEKFPEEIRSIAISPNGKQVACAKIDGTLSVINCQSGDETFSLHHPDCCWLTTYSADGKFLLSGGNKITYENNKPIQSNGEGSVRIWDMESGGLVKSYPHPSLVRSLCLSRDHSLLAVGGQDGSIRVWDIQRDHLIQEHQLNDKIVIALGFSTQNDALYSFDHQNLRRWELVD
jgi:WD40 repeat protein